MRYRLFGPTGLRVSDLFLGAMTYQDPEALDQMIGRYADAGGNVIDTASAYGDSEQVLGEVLGGRRDRFVLASKYTLSRDPDDPNASGNHRRNLVGSLDRSLRRLRTDRLDVLWVHIWDRHTPLEETMRALDDVVRAGKVLYVGLSDAPAWVLARANTLAEWRGWTPFAGLQVPYSLLKRDVERELLPAAEALGVSVAAWGPLAGGVLSGKYTRTGPADGSRVDPDTLSARDHAAARAAMEVGEDLGLTAAQVAIGWVRARSHALHPIIGARTVAQFEDSLAAADVVLPQDAVDRLSGAVAFEAGFPTDFIAETEASPWAFGPAVGRLDGR